MNKFQNKSLFNKVPRVEGLLKRNFSLSNLTWFKVGGEAEIYFLPKNIDDLINFLKNLKKEIPIKILGAGSNTLVRDGGIGGVTIKLAKSFSEIRYMKNYKVLLGAGLSCIKLARESAKKSLTGFEFFSGIPGTIGGAIKMNAGSYGNQTSDCLDEVVTINRQGKIKKYQRSEIKMSYRSTSLKKNEIIVQAIFSCKKGNLLDIKKKLIKLNNERKKTQPIKLKTSGSTFKNPPKLKAWELIRNSGCSELEIGGAKVSSLHSNFIINNGIAKASDVEELGNVIRDKVKRRFGVKLNWEIKIIGSKKKYRKYFNEKK
ncbi:MAG: UDP-N-acetylmuramate dehydrogenase [Pseudomonadota bacterium]|nr:UDP-N-acetylmuramate dehydrogenase [Pseudomonadota bacterium]